MCSNVYTTPITLWITFFKVLIYLFIISWKMITLSQTAQKLTQKQTQCTEAIGCNKFIYNNNLQGSPKRWERRASTPATQASTSTTKRNLVSECTNNGAEVNRVVNLENAGSASVNQTNGTLRDVRLESGTATLL